MRKNIVEREIEQKLLAEVGKAKLTLQERLKLFDQTKHRGEEMATGLAGSEKFLDT